MQKRRRHTLIFRPIVAIALLWTSGCGNRGLVPVEGTVTVGGKSADDGSISFAPADGQGPSAGTQIKNGKYQLSGAAGLPPGEKNVHITAVVKTGKQIEAGPPLPKGTMVDEANTHSGNETCKITPGQINLHNFDLLRPTLRMNRSAAKEPANPAGTAAFAAEHGSLTTSVSIKPARRK